MAPLLPPGSADSSGGAGGGPAKRAIGRVLARAYTARLRPASTTLEAANWETDTDLEAGTEKQVVTMNVHDAHNAYRAL